MPAESLIELARQVRGDTLRLLAGAPSEWLTWAPDGTSNHVLWHTGHALWLQDVLFVALVTGQSELPTSWADTFGMDCRPVSLSNQLQAWPGRDEIAHRLSAQLARIIELLQSIPPARLVVVSSSPASGRSLVSSLIHAWHDEAKHQGEIYLLLKLRRTQKPLA